LKSAQEDSLENSSWEKFKKARDKFRHLTDELGETLPNLKNIQQKLADTRPEGKNAVYKVETPVVYNTALDEITSESIAKLILVADNPGRREQAAENRRYLVGPSGKIAQKFFRDNPALGIDFSKNVIILNKTPIHTPRTNELRELCCIAEEMGDVSVSATLEESQKKMASLLLDFQASLGTPVWITGYSEMRKGGIFEAYTEKLKELYFDRKEMYKQLLFFRHFSMNQFTIDLKKQALSGESVTKSLMRIGNAYRKRILEGNIK
jgi:hypothetical protein